MIPDWAKELVKTHLAQNTVDSTFLAMKIAGDANRGAVLKRIIDWVCWNESHYLQLISEEPHNHREINRMERYRDDKGVFWMSMSHQQFIDSGINWVSDRTIRRCLTDLEKDGFIHSEVEKKMVGATWMLYTINFVTLAKALKNRGLESEFSTEKGQTVPVELLSSDRHHEKRSTGTSCPGGTDKLAATNNKPTNGGSASLPKPLEGVSTATLSSENKNLPSERSPDKTSDLNGLLEPKQLQSQPLQPQLLNVKLSELIPEEKKYRPENFKDDQFELPEVVRDSMQKTFNKPYTKWKALAGYGIVRGILIPHKGRMKVLVAFAYCEAPSSESGSYLWLEDGSCIKGVDKVEGMELSYYAYCYEHCREYSNASA